MLKKWLSYILPITIHEKKSQISKNIEVTWNNGKLVIDSENTNYSYGSLQKVLRSGLYSIGKQNIAKMNTILVLGVAGGSVIKTLVDEFQFKGEITGVELDKEITAIANQYFKLNEITNYTPIIADANEFVKSTTENFDLIIIDIFQDATMPDFLFEKQFISNVKELLNLKGFILFNTMNLDEKGINKNNRFIASFETSNYIIKEFKNIEVFNELILVEKIS
ncbi:fused MFS/spermidine synthase [Flavobacterium sp.]|jgi:spermidine synthase|uniref:spermidine synthase n=1 Tax=Flavobacterium sp. TaxID=239 RepID=UPI002A81A388|nr:fused MFS/spermidine synthase [Flavobacterium sp.]